MTIPVSPSSSNVIEGSTAHPAMPEFDRTRNGFHIGQVSTFISRLLARVDELEKALGRGSHALEHEAATPQGQQMIADLMQLATDEITGQKTAAATEIAKMIEDAEGQRSRLIAAAEKETETLVAAAREQVDTLLADARAQSKQMTDSAAARAAAVADGAARRQEALKGAHADTLGRLTEINQVTGQLLDRERDRGSLDDEVERVLPAVGAVAPQAALSMAPAGAHHR